MPSPEGLRVNVGTEQFFRGAKIRADFEPSKSPRRVSAAPASSTATHEMEHAVTAIVNGTSVESVSVIPGPGYNGITKLSRPDAIAAAAPFANNRSGTGHDAAVIRAMGYNPHDMARIAKGITYNNRPHIEEGARILDQKKTMSGSEVENIMKRVDEEKNKPLERTATIHVLNPDGTEWNGTNIPVTPEGTVTAPIDMTPGKWVYPGKQSPSAA